MSGSLSFRNSRDLVGLPSLNSFQLRLVKAESENETWFKRPDSLSVAKVAGIASAVGVFGACAFYFFKGKSSGVQSLPLQEAHKTKVLNPSDDQSVLSTIKDYSLCLGTLLVIFEVMRRHFKGKAADVVDLEAQLREEIRGLLEWLKELSKDEKQAPLTHEMRKIRLDGVADSVRECKDCIGTGNVGSLKNRLRNLRLGEKIPPYFDTLDKKYDEYREYEREIDRLNVRENYYKAFLLHQCFNKKKPNIEERIEDWRKSSGDLQSSETILQGIEEANEKFKKIVLGEEYPLSRQVRLISIAPSDDQLAQEYKDKIFNLFSRELKEEVLSQLEDLDFSGLVSQDSKIGVMLSDSLLRCREALERFVTHLSEGGSKFSITSHLNSLLSIRKQILSLKQIERCLRQIEVVSLEAQNLTDQGHDSPDHPPQILKKAIIEKILGVIKENLQRLDFEVGEWGTSQEDSKKLKLLEKKIEELWQTLGRQERRYLRLPKIPLVDQLQKVDQVKGWSEEEKKGLYKEIYSAICSDFNQRIQRVVDVASEWGIPNFETLLHESISRDEISKIRDYDSLKDLSSIVNLQSALECFEIIVDDSKNYEKTIKHAKSKIKFDGDFLSIRLNKIVPDNNQSLRDLAIEVNMLRGFRLFCDSIRERQANIQGLLKNERILKIQDLQEKSAKYHLIFESKQKISPDITRGLESSDFNNALGYLQRSLQGDFDCMLNDEAKYQKFVGDVENAFQKARESFPVVVHPSIRCMQTSLARHALSLLDRYFDSDISFSETKKRIEEIETIVQSVPKKDNVWTFSNLPQNCSLAEIQGSLNNLIYLLESLRDRDHLVQIVGAFKKRVVDSKEDGVNSIKIEVDFFHTWFHMLLEEYFPTLFSKDRISGNELKEFMEKERAEYLKRLNQAQAKFDTNKYKCQYPFIERLKQDKKVTAEKLFTLRQICEKFEKIQNETLKIYQLSEKGILLLHGEEREYKTLELFKSPEVSLLGLNLENIDAILKQKISLKETLKKRLKTSHPGGLSNSLEKLGDYLKRDFKKIRPNCVKQYMDWISRKDQYSDTICNFIMAESVDEKTYTELVKVTESHLEMLWTNLWANYDDKTDAFSQKYFDEQTRLESEYKNEFERIKSK